MGGYIAQTYMQRYPDEVKGFIGIDTCPFGLGYYSKSDMLQPYSKKELCHLMGIGYAGFLEENCDLEITCPTLLLVGQYDHTGKVQQYCDEWHKKTKFPLHIIPDAAHNSNFDNSESVNQEIDSFLLTLM